LEGSTSAGKGAGGAPGAAEAKGRWEEGCRVGIWKRWGLGAEGGSGGCCCREFLRGE